MITLKEFLMEADKAVTAEVNKFFENDSDKIKFEKEARSKGITIKYSKNRYADVIVLTGDKSKIKNILKKFGYSEFEIKYI